MHTKWISDKWFHEYEHEQNNQILSLELIRELVTSVQINLW